MTGGVPNASYLTSFFSPGAAVKLPAVTVPADAVAGSRLMASRARIQGRESRGRPYGRGVAERKG